MIILIVALLQDEIFGLLTQEKETLQNVKDLVPVFCATVAVFTLLKVVHGMVRGTGK